MEKIKIPDELEKEEKLLDELLSIFNHKKNDIKIIKDIIKKQFERYVFTKDNFIKKFLLIMRIRAGIPTILMGETGCGKTYLVRMFSLLYNIPQHISEINPSESDIPQHKSKINPSESDIPQHISEVNPSENDINMYTLKFHSGITDEDINNFIKKLLKQLNKKRMMK